jgi:hypothetical protein
LSEEKEQQVIALGQLGWTLRRIVQTTRGAEKKGGGSLFLTGLVKDWRIKVAQQQLGLESPLRSRGRPKRS